MIDMDRAYSDKRDRTIRGPKRFEGARVAWQPKRLNGSCDAEHQGRCVRFDARLRVLHVEVTSNDRTAFPDGVATITVPMHQGPFRIVS